MDGNTWSEYEESSSCSNSSILSDSVPESSIIWTGVVGNPVPPSSAAGAPVVLGEGLGAMVPSLSSTGSTGVVGWSFAVVEGGALANTGGLTSLYTELIMLGRNEGSVKTPDT